MAIEKLKARLSRRFNGLSEDQINAAIMDGIDALGYEKAEAVPTVDINLILAYVSAEIAIELATNAASYFSFTDGEESVDKTNIMENYTALAAQFRSEYEAEIAKREAAAIEPLPIFHVMKRVDR